MSDPPVAAPEVARVVVEELAVALDLPVGWELDFDDTTRRFSALGDETPFCDRDLCPSITVRSVPFPGGGDDFAKFAQQSLEAMPGNYEDFALRWADPAAGGRALRCYSFTLRAVHQPVVQLQGLIEAPNAAVIHVVDCSAPGSTFAALDTLYRHVVASLESLGPDYVSPDGP